MKEIMSTSKLWPPQDQVFWYLNRPAIKPCSEDIETDIAIIGGGMAGLMAAQACASKGKKVVLLEQYYCGSGASGKSSGFITPNAELSLTDFSHMYGFDAARNIWNLFVYGVESIRENIIKNKFDCDYAPQDTLVVALRENDLKELKIEHDNLISQGFKTKYYARRQEIKHCLNSDLYYGGVGYEDTFGISSYRYCQQLKKLLQDQGVQIFEETPVTKIEDHNLQTLYACITAKHIIVCADRFVPDLGLLTDRVYHAQTFLLVSQELTEEQQRLLFPNKNLMVWDTDLIYTYFRVTGDRRLLVGGGNLLTTFASQEYHNYKPMIKKLTSYIKKAFPELTIQFEQVWPGLIGIAPDIGPIAGPDKQYPYIYYVTACAGLPIAAGLGHYAAEHIIDGRRDLDTYFSPYRSFGLPAGTTCILGARFSTIANMAKKVI